MITRFNPPFRPESPAQWRGACATVAGGGPNRATAIAVARLAFTITGPTRGFTTLRLIDLVTATHRHLNELDMLEYGLQQLAHLEDELETDGAFPGPLVLALSWRTRLGTVELANAVSAATLSAEARRRLTIMPIEITTGYRRPEGLWPPRCTVAWLVHEFNARVASHVELGTKPMAVPASITARATGCRRQAVRGRAPDDRDQLRRAPGLLH
jgi:hypothetical protein